MDLIKFSGTSAFGRAYQSMMEQDSHAFGSVDRVLAAKMVRLNPQTADYLYSSFTPLEVQYTRGTRPKLDALVESVYRPGPGVEEGLAAIAAFTRGLGEKAEQDLKRLRVGGTEEEIIARGSYWCTDVARVACALCQVAGLPARIVNLFDLGQAYSGHVIVEVYRTGRWGALDSSTGVIYKAADRLPASTWTLMNNPELIQQHRNASGGFYSTPGQFSAAGIANYLVSEHERYDYTAAGVNDYYFSILSESNKGWPGGLRWLHGEDNHKDEPSVSGCA